MKFSKSKLKPQRLLLVGLVAVAGLAGCGSDSEDEEPIAKAQYVKQADAICSKTETRQQALVDELAKEPAKGKEAQLELVRKAGIVPLNTQLEELEELPEPKDGAKETEAFVTEFSSALEQVENDPEQLLTGTPFAKAEALADKAGFKVCGGA